MSVADDRYRDMTPAAQWAQTRIGANMTISTPSTVERQEKK